MIPYPLVQCPPAPTRISPRLDVPAPSFVLMPKRAQQPVAQGGGVEVTLEGTTLDVVLSTSPAGVFRGRAVLGGANIDKVAVPQPMIDAGILTPLPPQHGGGWLVAAGVVAAPLTVALRAVAPSTNFRDVQLTLTLEATGDQQVDPPVVAPITVVELTLDVDDLPRRVGAAAPTRLDGYAKVHDGGLLIAERAAQPLPRTKLTLRRAVPHDLPGRLMVQVSDEDGHGRQHVELATHEQGGQGDLRGPVLVIANASIDPLHGVALYARGLRMHPPDADATSIEVLVETTTLVGDYVNVFVDPHVEARWGHAWIYPEHDATLDAASLNRGDDRTVSLSEVELVIDTAGLPGDAVPTVTVHRCDGNETDVQAPGLTNLRLDGQGRVVTAAGQRPVFTVVGRRGSWRPPLSPFYFFKVAIPNVADTTTEKDPAANEAGTLRAKYLHAFVSDPGALDILSAETRDAVLLKVYGATHDRAAVAGPALTNHRFLKPSLGGLPNGLADWLNVARNTYGYFHFSHGGYGGTPPTQGAPVPNDFYCSISFGAQSLSFMNFHGYANQDAKRFFDFPRHVTFLASCHSAWDPRLARWIIGNRQDCYVIGFRQTILPSQVRAMAGDFFGRWLVDHRGDPAQVPVAFAQASQAHAGIQPVLFHRGSDFSILPL